MEIPIKHRRGTAAEWTDENPILREGQIGIELGVDLEPSKLKVGDGTHTWNQLPYVTSSEGVSSWADLADKPDFVTISPTAPEDTTKPWFRTVDGVTYTYFDGFWVASNSAPAPSLAGLITSITTNTGNGTTAVTNFVSCTLAVYEALETANELDPESHYLIVDAP